MTARQGWIIGGSTAEPYDGKWQPHWGVDLEDYATPKTMCFLVNDTHYTALRYGISSSITTNTITVIGASGVLYTNTATTSTINTYLFDPSTFSDSFPAVNGQTYGVYIITISTTYTGANIYRVPLDVPTLPYSRQSGVLWIHDNNGSYYSHSDNSIPCILLEAITGNARAFQNNCFQGMYSLIKSEITTYNQSSGIYYNCYALKEVVLPTDRALLNDFFRNCYLLQQSGTTSYTNNVVTTLNAAFSNCYCYSEPINITSTSLTNFGANNDMRSVPSIEVNAPLTLFVVNNAYSCKKLRVLNSNFKSLGSNTTVIDIRNMYAITEAELITFANNLEDLTGYVAKTISKAGTTNWTAAVTAILVAKNWTII